MGNTIPIPEDMKLQWEFAKAWWEEANKDPPIEFLPFIEDRPLILWLRGHKFTATED